MVNKIINFIKNWFEKSKGSLNESNPKEDYKLGLTDEDIIDKINKLSTEFTIIKRILRDSCIYEIDRIQCKRSSIEERYIFKYVYQVSIDDIIVSNNYNNSNVYHFIENLFIKKIQENTEQRNENIKSYINNK